MFATASQVQRWLLVEVCGSWGAELVADTELVDYVPKRWARDLKEHHVRPVAIRRDLRRDRRGNNVTLFYVEASHGGGHAGAIWRHVVPSLADVVEATAGVGDLGRGEGPSGWEPVETSLVLVCTNGRHDSCCANFGRPLVRHLRTTSAAESVWECSHIGGDRFAANVVVLPDSIYYGRVTVDSAERVLEAFARSELELDLYRGRSTLPYVAQAAEYFVRQELHLTAIDAVVDVRRLAADRFAVDVGGIEPANVEVVIDREWIPAPSPLTCTGPSDVTFPTYRLVSLERRPRVQA